MSRMISLGFCLDVGWLLRSHHKDLSTTFCRQAHVAPFADWPGCKPGRSVWKACGKPRCLRMRVMMHTLPGMQGQGLAGHWHWQCRTSKCKWLVSSRHMRLPEHTRSITLQSPVGLLMAAALEEGRLCCVLPNLQHLFTQMRPAICCVFKTCTTH